MTIDDDKEDDGKNDGGFNDPFDDSKELVAININAAEPTDVVGDTGGGFFLWRLNKNSIKKTSMVCVLRQHRS